MKMNIWNIIYLSCGDRYEFMIDHRGYTHNLSSYEIKAWKNSGLNGIRTHDLCDTGAVLYRLSYQAVLELVTLWVVVMEMNMWKKIYLMIAEIDTNLCLILAVSIHTTWSICEITNSQCDQFPYSQTDRWSGHGCWVRSSGLSCKKVWEVCSSGIGAALSPREMNRHRGETELQAGNC